MASSPSTVIQPVWSFVSRGPVSWVAISGAWRGWLVVRSGKGPSSTPIQLVMGLGIFLVPWGWWGLLVGSEFVLGFSGLLGRGLGVEGCS